MTLVMPKMQRFESEIQFEIPNMSFDTFSGSYPAAAASTESNRTLLRKLSETLSRGLSSSDVAKHYNRNQVVLNGSQYDANDWIAQMEYDRFMNEIWIGIVLTLIVISMVFCICSCFLYHQFRQWKRNYRHNANQNLDIESVKLNIEDNDSLPSYTLVSGLPSYDAALEQLQKSTSSCLLVYPSIYKVFSLNEKDQQTLDQPSLSSSNLNLHQQSTSSAAPSYEEVIAKEDPDDRRKVPSYEQSLLESSS